MGNTECKASCCEIESKSGTLVVEMNDTAGSKGSAPPVLANTSQKSLVSNAPSTPRIASTMPKEELVKNLEESGMNPTGNQKHVQAIVRSFIRDMKDGIHVELMSWQGGDEVIRNLTEISLDKDVKNVCVHSKGGTVSCPLVNIRDVFQMEDGAQFFPVKVVDKLSPEELDRLFLVHYELEGGSKKAFIMLGSTLEAKSRLVSCLRTLKVHAQQSADGGDPRKLGIEAATAGSLGSTPLNSPRSVSRGSPASSPRG